MAHINLSQGAIAMLSNGSSVTESDIQPVLQVADIRLINTQNQNTERYRILLSDGCFTQQGMLATQRNDLVRSEKIQKGSVIKLKQFVCNVVQNRMIIIIVDLDIILEKCNPIGEPKPFTRADGNTTSAGRPSIPSQPMIQPAESVGNTPSYASSTLSGSTPRPNFGSSVPRNMDSVNTPSYASSVLTGSAPRPNVGRNMDSGRYNTDNSLPTHSKTEYGSGVIQSPMNNYGRPPQSSYHQPPPLFGNRGPIAKNEAPPAIMPIAALNPYQGRWTIKARVTAKAELRRYNNARGEGKVFSFDLLDSDGGEIRVTCFNAVADQFYNQIEPGKIYMFSRGTLKPAQKNFNHLRNDHEIFLDNNSTVQPCFEDDKSIPQQQFHFRSISEIEGLENNSVVDLIGVVTSITPSSTIMRKNGIETQKRTLQLKDSSGRSVELTLWGNFCSAEGLILQDACDSGTFPVLAVKSGRVNEFNGKSVGTISTSQLFIEPDFPEARRLKTWFDSEGKSTPAISISREPSMVRTDARKTISQIKDEKLGTSEKPDWITIAATLTFIKPDNFCYTACPNMIGDRQCNKKVTDNGDGKWRCERCDLVVHECDFRYILQMQIQDHTGLTWVTAFQESGEEIIGTSARELYDMKHVEQDDEKFAEVLRGVCFTKYIFKLKVKEEIFSDEQRVKSTVVKVEKVNFQTETRYLLESIAKFQQEDSGLLQPKSENMISASGLNTSGLGTGSRQTQAAATNYSGISNNVARDTGVYTSQMGSYGNQYGGSTFPSTGPTVYTSCTSCGGTGHNSANCPSLMSGPGQSYGSSYGNKVTPTASSGGASGECFKCHQFGHWARDCPGTGNIPPAYGSNNATPGRYGMVPNQRVGGF